MPEDKQLNEDDGLFMPEVGRWANTKHRKIAYYSRLFGTSMKGKWDRRIYLDLFSGAGKARIKGTDNIIPGSPLLALNHPDPYDLHIFCDKDDRCVKALQQRVDRYFPKASCTYINDDCNEAVDDIIELFPKFSKSLKGLTLCIVDPFGASGIHFDTLRKLANRLFLDFLILIPTYMDIHRCEGQYTSPESQIIDKYLGTTSWRNDWNEERRQRGDFGLFIAELFCHQMRDMGFIFNGLNDLELVRMDGDQKIRLYHLAFFSRHQLGMKFWHDTQRNTDEQLRFF